VANAESVSAFLNSSGKPLALITSPMLTATVETRRAQLTACQSDRGADLCRWIVAGKLHNQEKLLRYFAKSRDGERGVPWKAAPSLYGGYDAPHLQLRASRPMRCVRD